MRLVFLFFLIFFQTNVFSQEKTITLKVQDQSLESFLLEIENNFEVRFSYSSKLISNKTISIQLDNKSLEETLFLLSEKLGLKFETISKRNITIRNVKENISLSEIQLLNEIILKNYLTKGIQKQKDGSFTISPKELEILPGITEPDIFQSLQLLPGIVSPDETSTGIYVRGGTPDQNLILWDGIKMYHSGHLFGTFSPFNPYVTNEIKFINKGTNAKYGDRISSVIEMQTKNEIAPGFNGGIGFNLVEFDGFMETPIIDNKLSILVSFRRSFTDFLTSNTFIKLADKVFQEQDPESISKANNNFYYLDYNLKLNWKLANNNFINFSLINIENELQTIFNDPNSFSINEKLETENQGYNLNWSNKWNSRWKHQTNMYYSKYALTFSQNNGQNFVKDPSIENSNKVQDIGFNLNFDYQINRNNNFSFGYQYSNYNLKILLSDSGQETDIASGITSLNSHSIYSSYTYKNEKLFDLTAGLRFNFYSDINEFLIEPRINIFKRLNNNFSIHGTIEKKSQVISQVNQTINQSLTLENQIWVVANNNQIPTISSWQISGGFTFSKNGWNLDIDTYFKEIEGLTTLNTGFIDIKDFQFDTGESSVKGADFFIKKQFKNYKTTLGYTLSSTKNNFEGINESESFPSNADINHNLIWTNAYFYKKFKFALGWRWHTGKPFSKAIDIKEDSGGEMFLLYDGINQHRLPNYSRLDFSSTYNFNLSKEKNIRARIGVSVLNIFNEENIINRSYTIDQSLNTINSADTKSLQRVFNMMFRVFW
jgi:hypothetical protein